MALVFTCPMFAYIGIEVEAVQADTFNEDVDKIRRGIVVRTHQAM